MANALNHTGERWQHFSVLKLILDFVLDCLSHFQRFQKSGLGFERFQLFPLILFECFLVHLAGIPDGEELQILEEVVVAFQRSEADIETCGGTRFERLAFRVDLEDCHILSIKVLALLDDPAHIQFAIHSVGELDLFLTADGHALAVAEIQEIFAQRHQAVLISLQEQLSVQRWLVLFEYSLRHFELVAGQGLLVSKHLHLLLDLHHQVVLQVLQIYFGETTLDHSLSEEIDVHLEQWQWPNEQIVASTYQIHVEQMMIAYYAVYALVVCKGIAGMELYDEFAIAVPWNNSSWLANAEDVAVVNEELVCCVQLTIIG